MTRRAYFQRLAKRSLRLENFCAYLCTCLFAFLVLSVFLATPVSAQEGKVYAFKVIVHPDNPRTDFTEKDLDKIFLKRDKSWDHGPQIEPVNQERSSEVRDAFSEEIHGRSTSSIESYWQRQIFSGRGVPPDFVDDDDSVVAYVAGRPAAIGYVSADMTLPDTVKVIRITGEK